MKKKLMMVAVLLGALTLGACVDDNESASVTNVRNAKAEQLKAAAELSKAQAEAELIRANAYKAYQEAEAEYKKALAEAEQLANEEQKLKVEKAKELYALQLEQARLEAQRELQRLKNEMASAEKEFAEMAYYAVQTAYTNYFNELSTLNTLKSNLVNKKAGIAALEAGIISAETANKLAIVEKEQAIAEKQAKLVILKDEAYAGLDNAELAVKAAAKKQEYDLAKAAFAKDPTCAALVATAEPIEKAVEELKAQNELLDAAYYTDYVYEDGYGTYYSLIETEEVAGGNWLNVYEVAAYSSFVRSIQIPSYKKGVRISEKSKLYFDGKYEQIVKIPADNLGTAADTKDKATAYGHLAAANDELKTAKAMPETTGAEKEAKTIAIQTAEKKVAECKDALAEAQKDYDEAVAEQKKYKDAVAAFDVAAYNDAVTTLVAAIDAQDEAEEAWSEAKKSVTELYNEWSALNFMANNNSYEINKTIATLENEIAEKKVEIENTKANITSAEVALESAKTEIENLEAQIEAQTKVVEAAKTSLDAAIAAAAQEEE